MRSWWSMNSDSAGVKGYAFRRRYDVSRPASCRSWSRVSTTAQCGAPAAMRAPLAAFGPVIHGRGAVGVEADRGVLRPVDLGGRHETRGVLELLRQPIEVALVVV